MPGLHGAADDASQVGQRNYVRAVATRAIAALIAAAAGLLATNRTWGDQALYVVAGAFLVALVAEVWVWLTHPERSWYDGRALAESSKSLAWRFSVAAQPYPRDDPSSDTRFLDALAELPRDAPNTGIVPNATPAITDAMRALRNSALDQRREAYLTGRIDDQRDWYERNAKKNSARAAQWRTLLLFCEFAGLCMAFARAAGLVGIDVAGLLATSVVGIASWVSLRQHDSLARAYTFAHLDLSIARERLRAIDDEHAWAIEAADAEEAVSREHTMWRASRAAQT